MIEALGGVWLSTIAEPGWRPRRGIRVAEIGPLAIKPGVSYPAQYDRPWRLPSSDGPVQGVSGA
jgi:hypothetical protein